MKKEGIKNSKRLLITSALILLLMISVTGATYAYFAITATNSTTVTGTAATVGLKLDVTEAALGGTNSGTKTNVMVPQLASALGTAIGNNYKCVDGNGNTVCKVYTITLTNQSDAGVIVNGRIGFGTYNSSNDTFSGYTGNVKWRRIASTTALDASTTGAFAAAGQQATNSWHDLTSDGACVPSPTATTCTDVPIAARGSITYYIAVWIDEIRAEQNSTDESQTFVATINFTGADGTGVTSTIIS